MQESSFAEEERESWLLYFVLLSSGCVYYVSLPCGALDCNDVARTLKKLRTSKGDYLIKQ